MKNLLLTFMLFSFLVGCNSIKDGLTLKKKTGADEFLVEKKNPLVLPPEFNELPTPDSENLNKKNSQLNTVKELLSDNKVQTAQSQNSTSNKKIEQNILEKIKNK
tara:strand:- start:199 stop:513 length:315 start_codon:yes stop_codon:yes gene_type:complete